MGNKTLIAYETKSGATEESAKKILQILRSKYQLDVDIMDLKEQKNPVAIEAFGGHAKILGKTVVDNLDLNRVGAWAEELGKKFTQ